MVASDRTSDQTSILTFWREKVGVGDNPMTRYVLLQETTAIFILADCVQCGWEAGKKLGVTQERISIITRVKTGIELVSGDFGTLILLPPASRPADPMAPRLLTLGCFVTRSRRGFV